MWTQEVSRSPSNSNSLNGCLSNSVTLLYYFQLKSKFSKHAYEAIPKKRIILGFVWCLWTQETPFTLQETLLQMSLQLLQERWLLVAHLSQALEEGKGQTVLPVFPPNSCVTVSHSRLRAIIWVYGLSVLCSILKHQWWCAQEEFSADRSPR